MGPFRLDISISPALNFVKPLAIHESLWEKEEGGIAGQVTLVCRHDFKRSNTYFCHYPLGFLDQSYANLESSCVVGIGTTHLLYILACLVSAPAIGFKFRFARHR